MRPGVSVAGIAAAAAATGYLFYRWQQRRQERLEGKRSVDVCVQTALTDNLLDPVASPPSPATEHEDTSVLKEAPMENQRAVVPFRIQHGSCRASKEAKGNISTGPQMFTSMIVDVRLHQISVCRLDCSHRWTCTENFLHPYPELCPKHYARVKNSIRITRHGCQIKTVDACTDTKLTSISLVQGNILLKRQPNPTTMFWLKRMGLAGPQKKQTEGGGGSCDYSVIHRAIIGLFPLSGGAVV